MTTALAVSATSAVNGDEGRAPGLLAQLPATELAREISFVSQVVSRRPPIPVLSGVMLTAEHGGLRATAHDYELSATAVTPAAGARGRALLPAGQLLKMLRAIGKADVTVRTDDGSATITGAGVEYHVPVLPAAEWPSPHAGTDHLVAILPLTARQRLRRTLVALSDDQTLPVLTSVHLHVHDGALAAACTDRYRLVIADALAPALATDGGWVLPGRAALLAMRYLPIKEDLQVLVSNEPVSTGGPVPRTTARPNGLMQLEAGHRSITASLVAGEYPKVRGLTPDDPSWSVTFDRLDLLTALRQVSVVARVPLTLSPRPGQSAVRVSAADTADRTLSAEERAAASSAHKDVEAADVDGELIQASFSQQYLIDALLSTPGDAVTVVGTLPTKPIVIRSNDDPATSHLVMPVRRG